MTELAYGQETAQWVLDKIREEPENHKQADWSCGTAHCVGGWALIAHGDVKVKVKGGRAAQLLGLSDPPLRLEDTWESDSHRLFYRSTEAEAVRALEYLAHGEPIDWQEVENPSV